MINKFFLVFCLSFLTSCCAMDERIDGENAGQFFQIGAQEPQNVENEPFYRRAAIVDLFKGFTFLTLGASLMAIPFLYFSENDHTLIQPVCKNILQPMIYDGQASVNLTIYPPWDAPLTTSYLCDFAHNVTSKSICCVYEFGQFIPNYLPTFETAISDITYTCLPFFESWSIFSGYSI